MPLILLMFRDKFRHQKEHKQSPPAGQARHRPASQMLQSDLNGNYCNPPGGQRHYTFNKVFLITMQTCTEEKFCSFATMAGEKSQLLQLIMCSDGLTDTQNCRSLVLTVLLRDTWCLWKTSQWPLIIFQPEMYRVVFKDVEPPLHLWGIRIQ